MATVGLWPVKCRLKEVIEYAENPDKTTDPRYLDDDLSNVLKYAEKDEKTDQRLFVAGINCPKQRAYETMMAVKRRFGKTGGTVAWHGFQSFQTGEVTPEEAFEIGKETARRMWGDKYQVVVTVHLNTDNLHCHFVVNPISFKDGSRFQNKIYNHRLLREISDEVCREHGKSVLENSNFYGGKSRGDYWAEKRGKETHRSMLRANVKYCLRYSNSPEMFIEQLKGLGYSFDRTRMSVRAKGWQRSVRLSSIGYTTERINEELRQNQKNGNFYIVVRGHRPYKPTRYPLLSVLNQLDFSISHSYDTATVLVDAILYIIIAVYDLLDTVMKNAILLSPEARHLESDLKQYVFDYRFMQKNDLHTVTELEKYISDTQTQITELEHKRNLLRNKIRRERDPKVLEENKAARSEITKEHIEPLRKDLKRAKRILEESPHLYELLSQERTLEIEARERSKEYSR